MTEKPEASVLTARRAAQHFGLSSADDACEHLYILTVRSSLGPSPPNAGRYTVASRFRCRSCERGCIFPRAPEQFVTSPLCLVGYVRWDARSDRAPPLQTIIFSSFPGRTKGCRLTGVTKRECECEDQRRTLLSALAISALQAGNLLDNFGPERHLLSATVERIPLATRWVEAIFREFLDVSRYYLRVSAVENESEVQRDCCAHAGAGNRGDDGDLQRGQRSFAARVAVSRAGTNCFA